MTSGYMLNEFYKDDIDTSNWERFYEWIHSICVITFDLELGQKIELIYPDDSRLTATEKLQICYLSFPDSNNNKNRDSSYHFRIKRSTNVAPNSFQLKFESLLPIPLKLQQNYLYGFVYFRQQKDSTLPRGYYQKSIVLLTILPLFDFFSHIIEYIACAFFDSQKFVIEKVCQQINNWCSPTPGETMSMQLLNFNVLCRIPYRNDINQQQIFFQFSSSLNFPSPKAILTIQETFLYNSLKGILPNLQNIWELMILGEPILVMTSTPTLCSQLVQSLILLIWPFHFCTDYRPYFTIQDPDFNEIVSKANLIIGVTNPFFAKILKHWPHIIKIDECNVKGYALNFGKNLKKMLKSEKKDLKPGFYSKHKPFLYYDKTLIKKLTNMGDRPDAVQNTILRKHFLELTQCFINPLERYIMSLMPYQKEINPFKPLPQIKPFSVDNFLQTIQSANTNLFNNLKGFYKKFILYSPNFQGWFNQKLEEINQSLKIIYFDMLSKAEFNQSSLAKCQHVEVVDIVLRLKDRLLELNNLNAEECNERKRINLQLKNLIQAVDDELKSILLSSEALQDIFSVI